MALFSLAFKSVKFRWATLVLAIASISVSVLLLLTVEKVKVAAEEGFTQSISQTDLIVGARTSPVTLLLFSVFNMGSVSQNVTMETYKKFKTHPAIEWTIPYSLGDGHKGFRVVGTNNDFFRFYRFRGDSAVEIEKGTQPILKMDAVLGADVARELKYDLEQKIVLTHGVTKGLGVLDHADRPFRVVGIMKSTGTALDRSIYIPLGGMDALHEDLVHDDSGHQENSLTAFFVKTKNRMEILQLQREINDYKKEALVAAIPAVILGELWNNLSYIEKILRFVSWIVLLVGLSTMLIALLTSLNERRREMAILRSLGTRSSQIISLFLLEAFVLVTGGIVVGAGLSWLLQFFLRPWIESNFGFYFQGPFLSIEAIVELGIFWCVGIVSALWPALKAVRQALKDGLTIKI